MNLETSRNNLSHEPWSIPLRTKKDILNQNQIIVNVGQQIAQVNHEPNHEELHNKHGDMIKSIVFGGVDGSTNSLIVILSAIASGAAPFQLIAIAISVVVGDAICMGLGDYLSAKAENDHVKSERKREEYQIEHFRNEQIEQIAMIYINKYRYEPRNARRLAQLYSTNDAAFANIMMLQELGLIEAHEKDAIICGITTTISFMLFGIIPVIPYIITSSIQHNNQHHPIVVIVIGAIELFVLGFAKAVFIGLSNKIRSGLQIFILGSFLTAIGYGIGLAFN